MTDLLDQIFGAGPAASAPRRRTIENGVITALSVSQLKTAHRCVLKWWFDKKLGLPRKQIKAQDTGIRAHKELEEYLLTGIDALGKITRPGKPYLPFPNTADVPPLLVEHRFDGQPKDAPFSPATAVLKAGGVPLDGYIDVVNTRLFQHGGHAYPGAEEFDEPGTVEVLDHKTTSDIKKWGAKREHLGDMDHPDGHAIQMIGYGEWARLAFPGLRRVRLTHVQYQTTTPKADRVSIVLDVAQIQIKWFTVNRLADTMVEAARQSNQLDIPYNTEACRDFGGCDFRAVCPRANRVVIPPHSVFAPQGSKMPGSILDDLMIGGPSVPVPAPSAATVAAAPAPAPVAAAPTYEQFLAWQQAQAAAAPAAPAVTSVAAPAAPAAPALITPPPAAAVPAPTLTRPAIQIQDVPETPAAPAVPTCTDCGATLNAANGSRNTVGVWKHIGCPNAAAVPSNPAPAAVQTASAAALAAPEAEKKPRAKKAPAVEAAAPAAAAPVAAPATGRVELYVDCTPGGESKRLEDWAAAIQKRIEEKYKVPSMRCAPKKLEDGQESPLAFGGWRGVVDYMVRARVEPLAPGRYTVSSSGELAQVIIEALVPTLRPEDVVRGMR